MDKIKVLFKNNIRQYGMGIALISIIIFFQLITGGILMKPLNVTNLILQNSYILVLAVGMFLCILTGNIDLSVGSVAAFVGAISAILSIQLKVPVIPTIFLSLLVGAIIGAWQGYWIAYVRIPPFIVTLAGMLVFRGLTMVILKGQTIAPFPESYQIISSGFIPDILSSGELHITTLVIGVILSIIYIGLEMQKRKNTLKYDFEVLSRPLFIAKLGVTVGMVNLFTYWLASYKGIPTVLILLAALILIYGFVTNKTVAGRHVYAFGGNEKAAKLSGVKTNRVLFWVYVNMSVLSALAGIVFAGRLNAATPKAGVNFELDAIAACYIGGASASGGIGTVYGCIIGGLIMGVLNNGMSILGVSIDWQQAIKGFVLLMAVAFDVYTKNKAKK
ncbi:ABC transporter permease [Sporanaerobium hydrogeniformans]|uniref:ABC transporter permease n=1 Tax=Sporanaerobium hydrogeniformans TaxID=3072179 RepID=A0AC61DHD0_9FIRM|nr:multiple monosaccharide ABC transporter permease [Sporanaerobium hydrogeniformans]PHV72006.1 ABC transporter permease [Sporanaerobium hydrogeniformans]